MRVLRPTAPHGQSMVELALVLPVFLVIVVGLFDFGRAIYAYNAIANAARVATRLAVVDQNEALIQQTAVEEAPGVNLQPSDVVVTYSCLTKILVCEAKVVITSTYQAATPLIEAIVGPISLSAESGQPIERLRNSSTP